MNKKFALITVAAAFFALATVLFLLRHQAPAAAGILPSAFSLGTENKNILARSLSEGGKPLVEVQARFLRDCPREEHERCEKKFWDDLGRYWGTDAAMAKAWYADVKIHEENLKQVQQSSSNMHERFQMLWQAHEQALGKDRAQQIYGRQKALADFNASSEKLRHDSATQAPDERVRAWETMRHETFGPYDEELRLQLGPHQLYQMEARLREQNGALAEAERNIVREKYFSAEAAEKLAQREQRETQQAEQVARYQTALEALNNRYKSQPGFPDISAYQQELEALRRTAF
jgi:hypothetical protein